MAKLQWFIRRPHAIDRVREYVGFSPATDDTVVEDELRCALDEAAKDPDKNFLNGCKPGEHVVRIALPHRNVVYAVLRKPNGEDKVYDYLVPTVLTTEMYQAWTLNGKLGNIGDLNPIEPKTPLPVYKPQLCMRWANGDGKDHWGNYCLEDVPEQIKQLLLQGVTKDAIKVYKEVPFEIHVSLKGIT